MIRIKDIQKALLHVVGWEQSFNPSMAIDYDMTKSESGLFFGDAHPLLTLDAIASIMPDDWGLQYPTWNMLSAYKKGQLVSYNNYIWIARIDNMGQEPTASDFNDDFSRDDYGNPFWKPYNPLSDYLKRMTLGAIATTIQTFLQMKQLTKETRNLLQHTTLFDGAGRLKDTIENRGKIVGFEIIPVRSMGVTTKIERIGLQFAGGNGMIRLYLFHSSQVNPIRTIDVRYTGNGGFQWFNFDDLYIPYLSEDINAGGSWYLCYNQDELPEGMQAINYVKDWSREPCQGCNPGNARVWREITKYLQVSPFTNDALKTFEEFPELWDIQSNVYTNTHNYGINCEISVECDLTDFIISQRGIFANVIQKQVAAVLLRTLAMNPNAKVNRMQSNVNRTDILYEIDGNTNGVRPGGLGYDLKKAYEALILDTTGIDRICLSCNNHGVRYRTI